MWSYFGSKGNLINYYPQPKHGRIIEPFAGTARYALKYFEHDVLLVDKYDAIITIWKWLQICSPNDILGLPRLKETDHISDFDLCPEARLLMGFLAGKSSQTPRDKPAKRATTYRPNNINFQLKRIAASLFKIRHWKIELGSYEDIPNQDATWFIDPPYQVGGQTYKEHDIDYPSLAKWCMSRQGQLIVCENTQADWLPFLPMKAQRGSVRWGTEVIWSNHETPYHYQQTAFA